MLPSLIKNAYPIKSKQRDNYYYQTNKVDLQSQVRPKSFVTPPSSASSGFRTTSSNQQAARYYDKKLITQRIEAKQRSMGGVFDQRPSNIGSSSTHSGGDAFNSQNNNLIMPGNSMNVKIVTDNISRNVLIYAPKTDGREKFQSETSYPESLKQIDRKILRYKRALEEAIRKQQAALAQDNNFFDDQYDILQQPEELLQDHQQQQQQQQPQNEENFDFLTGIGMVKQDQIATEPEAPVDEANESEEQPDAAEEADAEEEQKQDAAVTVTHPSVPHQFEEVRKAFSQIYQSYQNQISKAFIKKDQPKARVKRKNPKINITAKGNTVSKTGAPFDEVEHLMRVYNKEHIPCQPRILVPSFQQKKDNIANSVLAYLKDYRPLLSGNKANIPKSIQGLLEVELEMLKQTNYPGAPGQNAKTKQQTAEMMIQEEDVFPMSEQMAQSEKLFQPVQQYKNARAQQQSQQHDVGLVSESNTIEMTGSRVTQSLMKPVSADSKRDMSAIQQQQYVFPTTIGRNNGRVSREEATE